MPTKTIFDIEGYECSAYTTEVNEAREQGRCIVYDTFIPFFRIVSKNPCYLEMLSSDDKALKLSSMVRVEYEEDYDFMCAKTETEKLCIYLGIPYEIVEDWDERLSRVDEWGEDVSELAG